MKKANRNRPREVNNIKGVLIDEDVPPSPNSKATSEKVIGKILAKKCQDFYTELREKLIPTHRSK